MIKQKKIMLHQRLLLLHHNCWGGYFTIIQKIYYCAITENDQVHSEMNVCTFYKLLVWILLSLDRAQCLNGIFLEIERHI